MNDEANKQVNSIMQFFKIGENAENTKKKENRKSQAPQSQFRESI